MSSERQITHWAGCWRSHPVCARSVLSRIAAHCRSWEQDEHKDALSVPATKVLQEIDELLRQGELHGPPAPTCPDGLCRHAREATPPSTLPR